MMLSRLVLLAASLLYLAAFIASILFVYRGEPGALPRYTRRFLGIGLSAQIIFLALEIYQTRMWLPVVSLEGALNFFALSIVSIYFVLGLKREIRTFSLVVSPVLFTLLSLAVLSYGQVSKPFNGQMTVPFLIHIAAIFIAYGALFVSFTSAVFYLMQSNYLKSKKAGALFYKLPSLESLHEIINETMNWGFAFLTLGIVVAGFWLMKVQGSLTEWHTSAKLLISLLVWFFYLIIMIGKSLGFSKGKNAALFSVGAFSFAMIAFLGARFLEIF